VALKRRVKFIHQLFELLEEILGHILGVFHELLHALVSGVSAVIDDVGVIREAGASEDPQSS
jgi:hypothetical protein